MKPPAGRKGGARIEMERRWGISIVHNLWLWGLRLPGVLVNLVYHPGIIITDNMILKGDGKGSSGFATSWTQVIIGGWDEFLSQSVTYALSQDYAVRTALWRLI
jgi:hypothetical protein